MSIIQRCNNVSATFNRHSAEMKGLAIADGMKITSEWQVNGLNCFRAEHSQETLISKSSVCSYTAIGACVNTSPCVWYAVPRGGRNYETVFLPKES